MNSINKYNQEDGIDDPWGYGGWEYVAQTREPAKDLTNKNLSRGLVFNIAYQ
ncbi:unnamed protein product [Eruca vesicaria subsp. sativa]|uniref:Uncharacterized protein n=1 Tax=Eruca vesicaria subsp. sativa TaxID=29727 RepID=A0ABC8K3E1_ERUVS|nr:unnamed protein product [Eruca vesicaria subsp. sativa]